MGEGFHEPGNVCASGLHQPFATQPESVSMRFATRFWVLSILVFIPSLFADGLIPPLETQQIQQARKLLEDAKITPKGPYLQIRWFCKDGPVQPPAGTPCKSHGGGIQYAE